MLRLRKPTIALYSVYQDCISDNNPLRETWVYNKAYISCSIRFFNEIFYIKAETASLHTLPVLKRVFGCISGADLENLYTHGMVTLVAGRKHYDTLIASSPEDICPLCALRKVNSLDHYLPKAHYPQYAISPINLYPCCTDCNKAKGDKKNLAKENQTINPYFDNIENQQWLFARVVKDPIVRIIYYVDPPANWSATLKARVRNHVNTLSIKSLYASNAASLLTSNRLNFQSLYRDEGETGLRKHLIRTRNSIADKNRNQWDAVCYSALLESTEFIQRWHKEIAAPVKIP